ncbi:hypothetical protein BpHYR1_018447 [Brachionus plicatilis]|uniref:Uncharacterized protein n=1 Tax=Brachionus plicatilis TaxID=10195 RepID=A0A3M7PJV5_BRAPC|nr:hypothetical protein BpHYR1_018447 [Brachionus plicatilis]
MNSTLKNSISLSQMVNNNQMMIEAMVECSVTNKFKEFSNKINSNMDLLLDKVNNVNYIAKVHNLYNKQLRYKHHLKVFDTHLSQKSIPSTLKHTNFPVPFLQDDDKWVANLDAEFLFEDIKKEKEEKLSRFFKKKDEQLKRVIVDKFKKL